MLVKIALLDIPAQRRYVVKAASQLILPDYVQETHEEATVTCSFVGKNQDQLHFRLQLEEIKQSTNTEDSDWAAQLNAVLGNTTIQTDLAGNVLQIDNEDELWKQWQRRQKTGSAQPASASMLATPLMQAQAVLGVKNGLKAYLQHNSLYAILFPALYGQYELQQTWQQEKDIPGFLAEYPLPFTAHCSLAPTTEYDILRRLSTTGVLDETRLAQKAFSKWLRNRVDMYDLRVNVTAELEEAYDFERDGWLTHAEQFVVTEAAGCYSHTIARTLEELT
jgi:hypothetical protein